MSDVPPPADAPMVPSPAHLAPRAVPWNHAFSWYEGAMRLFKRAPATWGVLSALTLFSELGFTEVPEVGPLLAKVIAPLVACGLIYAAARVDGGERPLLLDSVAAFRASGGAIIAIILTSLLTFATEALTAWWIADANLLSSQPQELTWTAIGGIYTIGILVSLPMAFVPFHVLFESVPIAAAFAASWNGFALNTMPLLIYAAASLVLLGFGLVTMGIGLVFVLPLWAASSYVAWKDIFAVRQSPFEGEAIVA
jgi:hypothetical protein